MKITNELILVNQIADQAWKQFAILYGSRKIGRCPVLVMNGRFTRTLARAHLAEDHIEIATKYLNAYPIAYAKEIVPHELAHFVAYRMHDCPTHGAPWKRIMEAIGLKPSPYIDPRKIK